MKKKMKSKVAKKMVPLTKSLGDLMKDEDGFVSKETILKVGLSTVAALGVVGALTDSAQANTPWTSHTNTVSTDAANPNCVLHTNVSSHYSY